MASRSVTGLKPGFLGVMERYYTIWERVDANRSNAGGTLLASHTNGLAVLFVGENHGLCRYCASNGVTVTSFRFCDGSESERAAVMAAVAWIELELDGYVPFSSPVPAEPAADVETGHSQAKEAVIAADTPSTAAASSSSSSSSSSAADAASVGAPAVSSGSSSASWSSSSSGTEALDPGRLPRAMRKRASHKDVAVNVRDLRVVGGSKKGAPRVRVRTPLGLATLSNGRVWPVLSGASGNVYETNKRLEAQPELLLQGMGLSGLGHTAVMELDSNFRRRLVANEPPPGWSCIHRPPQLRKLVADDDDND